MGDDALRQHHAALAIKRKLDGAAEQCGGEIVPFLGKSGKLVHLLAQLLQLLHAVAIDSRKLERRDGDDALLELAGKSGTERRGHRNPAFPIDPMDVPSQEQRHFARLSAPLCAPFKDRSVFSLAERSRTPAERVLGRCSDADGISWVNMGVNGFS